MFCFKQTFPLTFLTIQDRVTLKVLVMDIQENQMEDIFSIEMNFKIKN